MKIKSFQDARCNTDVYEITKILSLNFSRYHAPVTTDILHFDN